MKNVRRTPIPLVMLLKKSDAGAKGSPGKAKSMAKADDTRRHVRLVGGRDVARAVSTAQGLG